MIDIVTTATIRPDILDVTYNSFFKHLFKDSFEYRLIINIDPVGDKRYTQGDVLRVAKKYFKNIVYNFPDQSNFTKAVKWCWSKTESDYVFHLEDDWEILKDVDIYFLIGILRFSKKIGSVRLLRCGLSSHRPFGVYGIEDSNLVIDKKRNRCSLNPTLFRGDLVRNSSLVMVDDVNPEYQLFPGFYKNIKAKDKKKINKCVSVFDHVAFRMSDVVCDIGREWRKKNKISGGNNFLFWSDDESTKI